MIQEEVLKIQEGSEYVYTGALPKGCAGHRYRVLKFVLDVPSYQQKVLVEALTGRDKGLWFVCSLQNFSLRYTPAPPAPEEVKDATA